MTCLWASALGGGNATRTSLGYNVNPNPEGRRHLLALAGQKLYPPGIHLSESTLACNKPLRFIPYSLQSLLPDSDSPSQAVGEKANFCPVFPRSSGKCQASGPLARAGVVSPRRNFPLPKSELFSSSHRHQMPGYSSTIPDVPKIHPRKVLIYF